MTTTKNTEASVLAHHGIAPLVGISDEQRTDMARDHGVLWACLGCGSIAGAAPGLTTEDWHAASGPDSRDLVAEWAECCADADSIIY